MLQRDPARRGPYPPRPSPRDPVPPPPAAGPQPDVPPPTPVTGERDVAARPRSLATGRPPPTQSPSASGTLGRALGQPLAGCGTGGRRVRGVRGRSGRRGVERTRGTTGGRGRGSGTAGVAERDGPPYLLRAAPPGCGRRRTGRAGTGRTGRGQPPPTAPPRGGSAPCTRGGRDRRRGALSLPPVAPGDGPRCPRPSPRGFPARRL